MESFGSCFNDRTAPRTRVETAEAPALINSPAFYSASLSDSKLTDSKLPDSKLPDSKLLGPQLPAPVLPHPLLPHLILPRPAQAPDQLTERHEQASHTLQGIDVYSGNGKINWKKAKADHVSFAFIKATEGGSLQDDAFAANWRGAHRAGIICGAYHYFRPDRPVAEQVKNFVGTVKHLRSGDLAPVVDLEEPRRWKGTAKQNCDKAVAFLREVKRELGVTPIIYMTANFAENVLGSDRRLAAYPLWLADYGQGRPDAPKPFHKYAFWQYSSCGRVSGLRGHVDRDCFSGTGEELSRLRKK